jgi:hypothetical protein
LVRNLTIILEADVGDFEHFSGNWTVAPVGDTSDFRVHYEIKGSDSSDGGHSLGDGPVSVTGDEWSISVLWWPPNEGGPFFCDLRRNATCELAEGLVVYIGADDNLPELRDGDYDDVVLRCHNHDPQITPWDVTLKPYDFSLPKRRAVTRPAP